MTVVDFSRELRPPAPTGIAAAGAGAFLAHCGGSAPEQAAAPAATGQPSAAGGLMDVAAGRRIDVHHYFTSPGWFKEPRGGQPRAERAERMDAGENDRGDGQIGDGHLAHIDGAGRRRLHARPSEQRGVTPAQAAESIRRLAREANEYGTKMAADYPGRFVLMASLPMPDLDASLKGLDTRSTR